MIPEQTPADQFDELWTSSEQPPDVFEFLQQAQQDRDESSAALSEADLLAVLLIDQQHRWQTDAPIRVKDYLQRLPQLVKAPQATLQLVIGEFRSRLNREPRPQIEDFTARFSDLGDSLRQQLLEIAASHPISPAESPPPPAAPATGTVVISDVVQLDDSERYQLETILGEGAFGRVYLAFDSELQRPVAIKIPTKERFNSPEDAEQYLAEARTVARLSHPNIVHVYDMGRTADGSVYVVSRLVDGGTLHDFMRREQPDVAESARLLATIAQALHHAHEQKIIHRDVKPANILIERDTNTPFLADFGLALRHDGVQRNRISGGSPAYMSPEQANGEDRTHPVASLKPNDFGLFDMQGERLEMVL